MHLANFKLGPKLNAFANVGLLRAVDTISTLVFWEIILLDRLAWHQDEREGRSFLSVLELFLGWLVVSRSIALRRLAGAARQPASQLALTDDAYR